MKKTNFVAIKLSAVVAFALGTALLSTLSPEPVQAAGDPIVVIVNTVNPVDNLSIGELKKLFLSDRSRWETGKAVAPVMVTAGAPERTAFLKIVCGMSDGDFGKYFLQAAFTGKSATPPKEVSSAASVKAFVATSPGAIGFVKAGDFHGDGSDGGVKSVKIDGIQAADAGYRLRM
jgi:ABC-type phosphate transport system substrate-binding protein